jgi:competence protein ComEA
VSRLRLAAVAALILSAGPAAAAKKPLGPGERVDLNRASAAELMRLPGVGRKKAEAMVALRKQHPFRRAEDVTAVKGVSAKWLARVRPHLSVAEPPASAAQRPPTQVARPARTGPAPASHRLPSRNAP